MNHINSISSVQSQTVGYTWHYQLQAVLRLTCWSDRDRVGPFIDELELSIEQGWGCVPTW